MNKNNINSKTVLAVKEKTNPTTTKTTTTTTKLYKQH